MLATFEQPQLAVEIALPRNFGVGPSHRPDVNQLGARRDGCLADSLVADRDGLLQYCGQALARLLGATPAAFVGRRVQDLLPDLPLERLLQKCGLAKDERPVLADTPTHAARMLETTREAWGLARPVARAHRIARDDGQTLPIDLTYGALAVRGGCLMVLGVYPRSTAAQARLQQLVGEVERSPSLALITDAGGRIESVNRAVEARLGYSAYELIGQPVATLLADPARSVDLCAGRPWIGKVSFRDRRGETFDEVIRIRPWAIDSGPFTHFACFGRDAVEQ